MGQKASDAVSGGGKDAQKEGGGLLNSASEGLSNAATSAQDALGLGSTCSHYIPVNLSMTLTPHAEK